ncbi:hypothetical protein ACTXL6_17785 [Brachybacterium tyrofermentans]|uniref:hypothetical protein n=1 Tax=Brachybacterium tyrofermentans TaxID=47848 RepID=UPI003FD53D2A
MRTPIRHRVKTWARALGPIVILAAAFTFLLSPVNALDLTSPGQSLEAAPGETVAQAVGAQGGVDRPDTGSVPACATVAGETDPIKCLPIVRWAMAMDLGNTVEFNVTQPLRSVEVNIIEKSSYTGILTFGNMVWLVAALIVNAATNYKASAQLVKPLNDFAATFGTSIVDSGAIFLVLLAGAAGIVFSATRGGFNVRRLLALLGSLSAFFVLIWGSMNDTGEGTDYVPGTGSPAWLVQEVSGAFSSASDAIATPLSDRSSDSSTVFSSDAKSDPTSCKSYIDELHNQYTGYYRGNGQSAPAALAVMSRWWEETAYRAFSDVQYGDQSSLGPDYAACQQLETQAQVSNASRNSILTGAYSSGEEDFSAAVPPTGSPMLTGGDTNANRLGRQNQAWGLCQVDADGAYTLRSDLPAEGIEGGKIGGPLTPEACTQIFTGDGAKHETGFVFSLPFSDAVSADTTVKELAEVQFAVVGDKSTLADPENGLADSSQAYYYVSNAAGTIRTTTTMNVIVYAIGALIGGIAMVILAGVLFIMKLLSYVMAFFLIIAALAGIVSQGFGSSVTFLKNWIGYTGITSVTTLLFAFVQMVALALVRTGDSVLGQWSLAMMLWIGLCPALAIFILNWAFRRLFKTNSPFTLRGMQAMAGNPALIGGAALAGGGIAKDLMDRGRRQLTNSAVKSIGGRFGGGKVSADSKSAAANEEILGDAQNPVPTEGQGTDSAKDAVASGAAGAAGVEGAGQDGVIGEGVVGAGEDDAAEGDAKKEVFDDSMVAGALNPSEDENDAQETRSSFAQRVADFDANGRRDDRVDRTAAGIAGAAAAVGTGVTNLGRDGRLALSRASQIPSNVRRQIAGGAQALRQRWADGKAARSALWNDKALVGQYLATKGFGAATSVVGTAGSKLAAAAKDPATYKRALKGAALYGGLSLASGGLAVPAAVLGGRALLRHRSTLAAGAAGAAGVGAHALTGIAKSAYRAGVPEMSQSDRQDALQSMELESRIRRDQSEDVSTPITELAHGLPVVQERQLTAELRDATASFDAFEAENGRAPEPQERAAMVNDLPFYSSMNEDPQLRQLFEQRTAEETAQAQQIFETHLQQHGEQMGREQMLEATRDLPFYAQSVRGLDPRQGSLEVPGLGNTSAPRGGAPALDVRSFDPLSAPEPVAVPVPTATVPAQASFDLSGGAPAGSSGASSGGRHRAPEPTGEES